MLGRFTRGMLVSIPARFQDNLGNVLQMDNVVVGIEHFNKATNEVDHVLQESPMSFLEGKGYVFEYRVPPNATDGNYIIRVKAKEPGSKSKVFEATDHFEVNDDAMTLTPVSQKEPVQAEEISPNDVPTQAEVDAMRQQTASYEQPPSGGYVEDICVDHENKPLAGVHINVYSKQGFAVNSTMNTKIASALSGEDGKWRAVIPPGDYVFTYKAINKREVREFRKVQ